MRAGEAMSHVRAGRRGEAMARAACVSVTGIGFMTPLGSTVQAFNEALFEGCSVVRAQTLAIDGLDPITLPVASCERDLTPMHSASRLSLDRGTAMALAVAQDAVGQAGLHLSELDPERLGVLWGSGIGGCASFDATAAALYGEHRRVRPTTVSTAMPNAAVAEIALHFGARGPTRTNVHSRVRGN
jgi:3-oxoacyl-[acyl-carrier-protein] synthase II